ncbi:MAG: ORF6N domain-containing protein [Polaromonas sp.]|nr:ORF6N domain-containing protein [Polaromonas sp.]
MATKKTTKAPLTVETLKHIEPTRKDIPSVESHIIPKPENLASLVLAVRGEKVLLDTDLAELYGVEARALNQAVARNRNRFPDDFMFQLTPEEWERVRSQTVMSGKEGEPLRSQTVISKGKGGRRYIPYAFTEQGVAMLSSVLRSQRAVEVNIAIMRTFVQLRRLMDSNRDLARRIEAMEMRYDEQFSAVFDAIKQLISDDQAKKSKPDRPIGFL